MELWGPAKKPIALAGGSKEKPNAQQVNTFDILLLILILYDESVSHTNIAMASSLNFKSCVKDIQV